MTPKQYLKAYFFLFIIIIVIGIFFFPISESTLNIEKKSLIETKLNQSMSVLDEISTEGSVLFLVTTDNDETYVIQAEKFLGFDRYRLLPPIIINARGESFELRSFLSDLTITVKNNTLNVKAQLNLLKYATVYIVVLLVFPIVGVFQSIQHSRRTKRKH